MKRIILSLVALALLALPAGAQTFQTGTGSSLFVSGNTSLSASSVSSSVALPGTGSTVLVCNPGTVNAFINFGSSLVTATTSNILVPPSSQCQSFNPGSSAYVAAITASSTTTLYITQGTGQGISNIIGTTASDRTFLGVGAGNPAMTGLGNTVAGIQAGASLTVPGSTGGQACIAPACIQQDTFYGYQAGMNATSARETTCIGFQACVSLTGTPANGIEDSLDMGIGSYALQSCTNGCTDVVAVGQKAAESLTSGGDSVFLGNHAGTSLTTGVNLDTYIGGFVGNFATTTGGFNTCIGGTACTYLEGTASNDVWVGYNAGAATAGNPDTASLNTGVGASVGVAVTSATQLALLGFEAGHSITTGSGSVLLGYEAGFNIVGGAGDIAIGQQAAVNLTGSHDICIGTDACNNAPNASNNLLVMGGDGSGGAEKITDGYFGKGYATASPTDFTFHATGGSGTDIAGANLILGGGQGTGAGAGGQVKLAYAPAGGTGTGLNALVNEMLIGPGVQIGAPTGGDKGVGTLNIAGAIWANGTVGVSCSGSPTASFASIGGVVTHC